MTNLTAAGTASPAQPGEWVADLADCTVSFPGTSDRRAPDTKAPAKEGHR